MYIKFLLAAFIVIAAVPVEFVEASTTVVQTPVLTTTPLLAPPPVYEPRGDKITKENIVAVTNRSRQALGLHSLEANTYLTKLAQQRAEYLASHGEFQHLLSQADVIGTDWKAVGENLAVSFTSVTTMQEAWITSRKHFRVMSAPYYRDIGVGIATGTFNGVTDTTFVVVLFGRQWED